MKKVYEQPSVKKVEFEFNERIAASGCTPLVFAKYDSEAGCTFAP